MPGKTLPRKIIRQGTSKVVALPPDWLRAFGLDLGDEVDVVYDGVVIVKPQGLQLDPEFLLKQFENLKDFGVHGKKISGRELTRP